MMHKFFLRSYFKKFPSIQARLFLVFGGLALLICISYTAVALLIAYVTEDAVINKILSNEAAQITAHYQQTKQLTAPRNPQIVLVPTYAQLPAIVRATFKPTMRSEEIFAPGGQHYHVTKIALSQHEVAYLLAEVSEILVVKKLIFGLADFMLLVAVLMLILALGCAYLLARRLAQPLRNLAHEVSHRKQHERFHSSAASREDELGLLAQKLESSFNEVDTALLRESHFTRDISHELRTPMTIMNNVLMVNENASIAEADRQLMRATMQDMQQTLEVLLALARAENMQHEPLNFTACIEQSLLQLSQVASPKTFSLALDVPERWMVLGNAHLIALLLNNLLSNALYHGEDKVEIVIELAGDRLTIRNKIASGQSSARAGSGLAHGTHLMLRIAQVLQWTLEFKRGHDSFQVDIWPALASPPLS